MDVVTNRNKTKGHVSQPQQREPISLAPLPFEEALADLLKTGPHPQEKKQGKEKPSPKIERRPKKSQAQKSE